MITKPDSNLSEIKLMEKPRSLFVRLQIFGPGMVGGEEYDHCNIYTEGWCYTNEDIEKVIELLQSVKLHKDVTF